MDRRTADRYGKHVVKSAVVTRGGDGKRRAHAGVAVIHKGGYGPQYRGAGDTRQRDAGQGNAARTRAVCPIAGDSAGGCDCVCTVRAVRDVACPGFKRDG